MIGAHESSPWMTFTVLGSDSTIFTEESSSVWKNTFVGSVIFLATTFTSSLALLFFALLMCSTKNPLN
jgi:hypothetical protein